MEVFRGRLGSSILLLLAAAELAFGASSTSATSTRSTSSASSSSSSSSAYTVHGFSVTPIGSTITNPSVAAPTGSYESFTANITLATTGSNSTSTDTYVIVGGTVTSSITTASNSSATATTTSATPTNTQPCNDYVEFCERSYSNITIVAAHNAPFVRANSAFSNQEIEIIGQLNDGIRMLEGEVHYVNGTMYNCHTSCDYLNAGTYESMLVTVREWVEANPYNVVTLLISNSDFVAVTNFSAPFEDSGILPYVYTPPQVPMLLSDWPTLGEMILKNQRVVVFMDYEANATAVPYIIDQYGSMWQTPFSPTDPDFPCTLQDPPGLSSESAKTEYMYVANHNLNVAIAFAGLDLLIPDFSQLATVNADNSSTSSLLTMTENCDAMWGRPPNFLIVDFYNIGSSAGSVFEVAAQFNNVTYTMSCCGLDTTISAAASLAPSRWMAGTALLASLAAIMLFVA